MTTHSGAAPSGRSRVLTWARRVGAVAVSVAMTVMCLVGTAGSASAAETKRGGYYGADTAERITKNLITASTVAGVGCGMHNLAKSLRSNRAVGKTYLGAIAQKSAEVSSKVANSKGFCKTAAQLLEASALIATYAYRSGRVYVMETSTTNTGIISKTVKTTFDVGPGPGPEGARRFTMSTKMARWS